MKTDELAKGYARALLEIAMAEDTLGKTEEELFAVSKTVKDNLKLKDIFEGKLVETAPKKAVLNEVFGGKVSPVTLGFLMLLVDAGKEKLFFEIAKAFSIGVASKRNSVVAEVVSAVPLDDKSVAALTKTLEEKLNKKVELRARVNKDILGGLVVKVGDKLIDASLKNKLDSFKKGITLD